MSRSRSWLFVINNWQDHEPNVSDFLSGIECEYMCYQFEVAPTTGTRHVQGFVYFTNAVTLGGMRRRLRLQDGSYPHFEIARGTASQNRAYCSKEETRDPNSPTDNGGFCERGSLPQQGQRTDIGRFVELARSGATIPDVLEECPQEFVKYHRAFDRIRAICYGPRRNKTIVKWFWGPTGCGKSHAARDEAGDDGYWKSPSTKWWDGYVQNDVVVIDDYRPDFCKFSELLRLFDEYPLMVESKGGYIHFNSKIIVVTCPKPPDVIWSQRTEEDMSQLMRRIEEVKEFNIRNL